MNAVVPYKPSGLRMQAQRLLSKAFPTWVYPGPVTAGGIFTQDSGFLPCSYPLNYWQCGHQPTQWVESAAVEACVSAYAQTVAMCRGDHWRRLPNGGRVRVADSPLARVFERPNPYQTRSDLFLNVIRALYMRGNSYCLAEYGPDGTVVALHPLPPQSVVPAVDPETRDVYYSIQPTDLSPVEPRFEFDAGRMVPARYVWHLKLHTAQSPLIGVTPLTAAAFAMAASGNINSQQARFFENMSRPSGTLSTEMVLTKAQVDELRARWNEQSAGANMGGVPILTAGLKWNPLTLSVGDATLIDLYKVSVADVARVMRVPGQMIGIQDGSAPANSTEALMQFWIASGLGFLLEHVELSLDAFFGLPENEYSELDTKALLRSNFKERIEGIVRGVQGGIYTPNEGRAEEGLSSVESGDEPRMQQQVVPLTWWEDQRELEEEKLRQSAAREQQPPAVPVDDPPEALHYGADLLRKVAAK